MGRRLDREVAWQWVTSAAWKAVTSTPVKDAAPMKPPGDVEEEERFSMENQLAM